MGALETKKQEVDVLKERFSKAKAAIFTDYRGLTVTQFTELRNKLKEADANIKVVKNRLAKRAFNENSVTDLDGYLKGPVAIADSETDPVAVAKIVTEFAKENEKFEVKVGFMDGKVMDLPMIKQLASLPSREELLAKVLGSISSPATKMVNVLAAVPRQLVTVIKAIGDTKA